MELKKENLSFVIAEKNNKKNILFLMDLPILDYQKTVLETVSFFYDFKDFGVELEEDIISKMELNGERDANFIVLYEDNVLYEINLERQISKEDIENNEMELYFFFEKNVKKINASILEEHKSLILSGN